MIKSKLRSRAASLAVGAAMLVTCIPAGVYADSQRRHHILLHR